MNKEPVKSPSKTTAPQHKHIAGLDRDWTGFCWLVEGLLDDVHQYDHTQQSKDYWMTSTSMITRSSQRTTGWRPPVWSHAAVEGLLDDVHQYDHITRSQSYDTNQYKNFIRKVLNCNANIQFSTQIYNWVRRWLNLLFVECTRDWRRMEKISWTDHVRN
jgi:hypothetical protein